MYDNNLTWSTLGSVAVAAEGKEVGGLHVCTQLTAWRRAAGLAMRGREMEPDRSAVVCRCNFAKTPFLHLDTTLGLDFVFFAGVLCLLFFSPCSYLFGSALRRQGWGVHNNNHNRSRPKSTTASLQDDKEDCNMRADLLSPYLF
jgi:hypothetical protein